MLCWVPEHRTGLHWEKTRTLLSLMEMTGQQTSIISDKIISLKLISTFSYTKMPEGMCPASFCNSSSPWWRFFTIMDQGVSDKDTLLPLLLAPLHGKTKYTLRGCRVHRWRIVSLTSGNLHWSDTKYHRALESERGHSSSGEAVAYTDCVLRPSGSVLVKCFVLFSSQMIDTQCYYKNKWSNSR